MSFVAVEGRLLRWGNSFGLRLSRAEVERLRLEPDKEIRIHIDLPTGDRITAHELPVFDLGGDAADRHDDLAARAAQDDLERAS